MHLIHSTTATRSVSVDDEHDGDDDEEKEDSGRRSHIHHSWLRRRRRRFQRRDDDDFDENDKEEVSSSDSRWTLSLDTEGSSSLHLSTVADEFPLPLREAVIELLLQQQILSLSPARAQESPSKLESLVLKNQAQISDDGLLRALAGGVSRGLWLSKLVFNDDKNEHKTL